jgi:hypothetical protein
MPGRTRAAMAWSASSLMTSKSSWSSSSSSSGEGGVLGGEGLPQLVLAVEGGPPMGGVLLGEEVVPELAV